MNDEYDDIPEALKARFKALDDNLSVITPREDAIVLGAARRQFGGRRVAAWVSGALAASLVIGVLFLPDAHDGDDVDGSGTVDIVDAMLLARDGAPAARVDQIARRVVSLGDGS